MKISGKSLVILFVTAIMVMSFAMPMSPVYASGDLPGGATSEQTSPQIKQGIETILALPAGKQEAALNAFVSKLPISEKTKKLQNQAGDLVKQLASASPQEAEKINQQLLTISAQIAGDPVLKQVNQSFQEEYVRKGVIPASFTNASPNAASFGSLKVGDILARRSGWLVLWPWAMVYEHTGNYYGNNLVFESNADGVRTKALSTWKTGGQYVGLARNNKATSARMASAVTWAANKYGTNGRTSYNYNFLDKGTDSRLYCSQLSWKISQNAGVNVDSNSAWYISWVLARFGPVVSAGIIPAVAPDEVMLSSNVTVYSTGWN